MNFKYVLTIFNRIFLVKKSIETQCIDYYENFFDKSQIYFYDFNNLSFHERIIIHNIINSIT